MSDNLLENDENNKKGERIVETLSSKFINEQTGEIRVEALVKSYLELEKKLSKVMKAPETEEEKFRMAKMRQDC